ncbi:MAG: IPT/TIG domain-containing protein [Candidatus Hydrogenedentes bacterium]|nr:IPT/TIG domain-containing protein [Candidatus Hydrogenedentota bacterium]
MMRVNTSNRSVRAVRSLLVAMSAVCALTFVGSSAAYAQASFKVFKEFPPDSGQYFQLPVLSDESGNPYVTAQAPRWLFFEPIPSPGKTISQVFWDFGTDAAAATNPTLGTTWAEVYFLKPGDYKVTMSIVYTDSSIESITKEAYVKITEQPSVDITVTDMIPDTACLLPLNDWVPLFRVAMKSSNEDENIGFRLMRSLAWEIREDQTEPPGGRPYDAFEGQLALSDLLEFKWVREGTHDDPEDLWGRYTDDDTDTLHYFAPDGTPLDGKPANITVTSDYTNHIFRYEWNLFGTPPGAVPDFWMSTHQYTGGTAPEDGLYRPGGEAYILLVRTAARWRHALTLSCRVYGVTAVVRDTWQFPLKDDGGPLDNYDPAGDGGYFSELICASYASSFGVWDITGGYFSDVTMDDSNMWNWVNHVYTPIGEYRRPRFDVSGSAFDFVAGECLDLRRLIPTEQFIPLIGINIHGPSTVRGVGAMTEVNVVLTDIGADPNGPPGNGGFNPTQGLEGFTDTGVNSAHSAFGLDYAFNGLSVYHDTNGNGKFDVPTPSFPGVTFTDHPMYTEGNRVFEDPDEVNPGLPQWEYIPNPPGGGDPWWKIRLRLWGDRRRAPEELPTGYLEPTSESKHEIGQFSDTSSFQSDYFVVARPDSGYADISGNPGDGIGLTMGADFRAFIEPRRFNPNYQDSNGLAGHEDGGIYATPMVPEDSLIGEGVLFGASWQDDARWLSAEPFWPERTQQSRNTKPVRSGAEFHDLVLNYETNNLYARVTQLAYGESDSELATGGGFRMLGLGSPRDIFGNVDPVLTNFDTWLDPFGLSSARFLDYHTIGVYRTRYYKTVNGTLVDDQQLDSFQYPYETVPFFSSDWDLPPYGPRSSFFTTPPALPTLPRYVTWPASLLPDEYPEEFNWSLNNRRARYLKQHVEILSRPVAMLGVNLCGADDSVVNQFARIKMQQLTVAFWGPNFTPSDLQTLDPLGISTSSGVALVEDTNGDGVFGIQAAPVDELTVDSVVPLTGLAWKTAAEPIDLDGDGVADDLNGDGVVTSADNAWVLRLRPTSPWQLPVIDAEGGNVGTATKSLSSETAVKADKSATQSEDSLLRPSASGDGSLVSAVNPTPAGDGFWSKKPQMYQLKEDGSDPNTVTTKAIGPSGNGGDDLFVIVRTSETIKRFEQFRILVPSTLPTRTTASDKLAGLQLTPQMPISTAIYEKAQPEEGPVAKYWGPDPFGFDMLEANVGVKITGLTGTGQTIVKNSADTAVLGVSISTNRGDAVGTAAQGALGNGALGTFSVPGAAWSSGAFTGYFLIDRKFEQFLITGNTSNTLTLESGTPQNGPYRIVRDPTFLEQLIVEFYDVGNDGKFNILDDLLPFNKDPKKSGVAIYRDNDYDGVNGVFDSADIPVEVDYEPFLIGQAGEPSTQVMFVFSTPGTDNVPMPRVSQTRHRQWVPDSFGSGTNDPATGDDFFVVIRTSDGLEAGDDFSVGIVSWGPNTPTEPDPDTFPPPPATRVGEFDVFSEFPWGARAVGLITFFEDEQYYKQYPEVDNSGFNWVRSTVNKSEQTRTVTAATQQGQVNDVIITAVVPNQLPKTISAGGLNIQITGQNFGTAPTAAIDGVNLTIITSSSTSITATIPGGTTMDPDDNSVATLRVTNTSNSKFGLYAAFTIGGSGGTAPSITGVNPSSGTSSVFPVTITGSGFIDPKVYFGSTLMPVQSYTANQIIVGFPVGGLPTTGALDITVQNQPTLLSTTLTDGFTYVNSPGGGGGGFQGGGGLPGGGCFIATAAFGTPFSEHLDAFRWFRDAVLLKSSAGTALVDAYYTASPAIADTVAQSPFLAWLVRLVLTPVAWAIEMPSLLLMLTLGFVIGRAVRRKLRRAACAS